MTSPHLQKSLSEVTDFHTKLLAALIKKGHAAEHSATPQGSAISISRRVVSMWIYTRRGDNHLGVYTQAANRRDGMSLLNVNKADVDVIADQLDKKLKQIADAESRRLEHAQRQKDTLEAAKEMAARNGWEISFPSEIIINVDGIRAFLIRFYVGGTGTFLNHKFNSFAELEALVGIAVKHFKQMLSELNGTLHYDRFPKIPLAVTNGKVSIITVNGGSYRVLITKILSTGDIYGRYDPDDGSRGLALGFWDYNNIIKIEPTDDTEI